jgi:hypothetical protein
MTVLRQKVLAAETALALRRFNAWWEGYAFDAAAEKADIESRAKRALPPDLEIPPLIWGVGRVEPGDPSWSMRHARALGLGPKSRVTVFGAGAGAPLLDLKAGARWTVRGLGRVAYAARGLNLGTYDEAMAPSDPQAADGAIVFFELHRDGDPAAFARYAAEFLKPGAPAAFVDFALTRAEPRMRSGFDSRLPGAPRLAADYARILKDSGFGVGDVVDETRLFLPLIARGFAGWRRAYEAARAQADRCARAEAVRYLGDYAAVWADRFESLKSGALQVVRISARRL